ncbi:MAG: nucleotidyl transferase AbiEii/AbiGii toxin family protein [Candidatus Wallbacteria bacterium]|nr:nucleotidyl transferase AbiEii/AbiGii toxin family protein [Candidatus Wallbacteria bacterium]
MDFRGLLTRLADDFRSMEIDYALIGGISLGFWGVSRATMDLDFLILDSDMEKAEKVLAEFGYKPFYKTADVAQYSAEDPGVPVDVIIACRKYTHSMLEQAETKSVEGSVIRVLRPEGLIGLKLQALYNNPDRERMDWADIEALLAGNKGLDWPRIEEYFLLFGKSDRFVQLKEKHYADR